VALWVMGIFAFRFVRLGNLLVQVGLFFARTVWNIVRRGLARFMVDSLRRLHDSKPGKMRLGPDAWRRKVPSMSPMERIRFLPGTLYEEDHE